MLEPLGAARDPEVLRVNGDAHRLPVREHSFDAVLAMFMLYHVDVSRTLPECRHALKPGGRVFAATTDADLLPTLGDLLHSAAEDIAGRVLPGYWAGTMRFSSENGHEVLAPYFDRVELAVHETEYVVPVAAPLVSYVASLRGPMLARVGETFDYDAFLALARTPPRRASHPAVPSASPAKPRSSPRKPEAIVSGNGGAERVPSNPTRVILHNPVPRPCGRPI